MKTVIFYSSTYNGNTLKIAESIAATLSADLIAIETKISDFDLSQYDLIGIGSAIHFGQHAIRLQRFVSALPLQGKNIFIFSTRCRPFLGNYHRTLKNIIKQKKANLVDEFSCVGFDRTGPWVLINGYNKTNQTRMIYSKPGCLLKNCNANCTLFRPSSPPQLQQKANKALSYFKKNKTR